jgi:transposase-like protein
MDKSAKRKKEEQGEDGLVTMRVPGAAALQAGLHALVVTAGLEMLASMLERDREELCGPRYEHNAQEPATRAGHVRGELALGGRRVAIRRPRVRANGREVPLPTWQELARHDALHERAVEQILVGVSTRKYGRSLEPAPESVETRGDSRSAVSRRFVAVTQARVNDALNSDLSSRTLVVLMLDGLIVGDHTMLIALGIDEAGNKHVLGLHEGATENSTACLGLLTNLRDRGLKADRALLVVIDGGKALRSAVRSVFGRRALVQRCQVHKVRNVLEHLPEKERARVRGAMWAAYASKSVERARRLLNGLATQLEVKHPSAAGSLREGLDETLTVISVGLEGTLARTLSTTNSIENLNGLVRQRVRNVKRWNSGQMVLRWLVAALDDSAKGFRRFRGYRQLPDLIAVLRAHDTKLDQEKKKPVDDTDRIQEAT